MRWRVGGVVASANVIGDRLAVLVQARDDSVRDALAVFDMAVVPAVPGKERSEDSTDKGNFRDVASEPGPEIIIRDNAGRIGATGMDRQPVLDDVPPVHQLGVARSGAVRHASILLSDDRHVCLP
jgi:hypothetical protein